MANASTVRLHEQTARELTELAERRRSRPAAVQDARHQAWEQLQTEELDAGYAAAIIEVRANRTSPSRNGQRSFPAAAPETRATRTRECHCETGPGVTMQPRLRTSNHG